jgi:hypothetical protein
MQRNPNRGRNPGLFDVQGSIPGQQRSAMKTRLGAADALPLPEKKGVRVDASQPPIPWRIRFQGIFYLAHNWQNF